MGVVTDARERRILFLVLNTLFKNCKFQQMATLIMYISVETLTTGQMIHSGTNSPLAERYRSSDRNADYWADDTLGD